MNKELYTQALSIVQLLYGKDARFRKGQYEAIEATLTHRKTLIVQKTGWGKSLVYFICTKIQRNRGLGITLVVSPLLVLMENQLQAAEKLGLRCAVLNSSTNPNWEKLFDKMRSGSLDLVLITPETLFSDKVQEILPSVSIGLFVVDEVHCISDWGHDFRLEYTRLNRVIQNMPQTVPVLGTTATANDRVIYDLKQQFGTDVFVSRGPLMRHSLSIQILHLPTPVQRYAWLLQNIPKLPGSGIIYCLTQRNCEQIAEFLLKNGIQAQAYHSGMEQKKAEQAEQFLRENRLKVLVSTIKLGMGYDKDDISFVIHYQQPSNIVAYYQQIGRAGRNIDRAYTFLMCGKEDEKIQDYFIETAFPTEQEAKIVYDVVHENTGITEKKIQDYVNIRKTRIDKALMFLRNEEQIFKEGVQYFPTSHPFYYNREHYDKIKTIRYNEQRQVQELTNTKECLSRFVVNCLDDPTTENCGICQNCIGYAEFLEQPDTVSLQKAQAYLKRLVLSIEPKKQFPSKDFTGSLKIPVPNQKGLCLSKYGDPGYGELVRYGKYGTPPVFCEELIEKSKDVLQAVVAENNITAITCVPSLRSEVVSDFTKKLAERLRIPFVPFLQKNGTRQQKDMQNSCFQRRNAWYSFSLIENLSVAKKLILVDDIVDSGWTMTVCGYLLTQAGCDFVFPFALADSSENRRRKC